jgi:superfamily II DNA/RNA helicase
VFDIYVKTGNKKSAQLIFCDTSTPKNGFNVYDEVKRLLVSMGIPPEKIAFIHDADTDIQRAKLFAKVRCGDVRILIGSTFKLGLGVNVQNKLVALHHLDVPWRPADMTQREGRILRQGNENERIDIYRYITEGSFDAYSWQLLETKQRFITGLLSGSLTERSGSDIESTVLDYAEVKALAVGNPLVKKRVEAANELSRYLALQRKAVETHVRLEKELMELPARINHQAEVIEKCKLDIEHYHNNHREIDKEERKAIRGELFAAVKSNVLMPSERVAMTYQGFDIVLPVNMTVEKPFIWLQKNGRYYVELADTEFGMLVRIDNYLDKLEEHLEKMQASLSDLYARQSATRAELSQKENYTDKIEEIKARLEKLDKKLGVNKK